MSRARKLLAHGGLSGTKRRVMVVECLEAAGRALRADEIMERLEGAESMNKVTLYRILDKLVEKNVVLRVSSADRSFRYCLGHGADRRGHCHFYCRLCGRMQCLPAGELGLDRLGTEGLVQGRVESVEVRLDGVCARCAGTDF